MAKIAPDDLRLPMVADLDTRDGSLAKGALMVNALAERHGAEKAIAFKRPGLSLQLVGFSHATGGVAQGMAEWKGKVYSIDGDTVTQWTPIVVADGGFPLTSTEEVANFGFPPASSILFSPSLCRHENGDMYSFSLDIAAGLFRVAKTSDGALWTSVGSFNPSAFNVTVTTGDLGAMWADGSYNLSTTTHIPSSIVHLDGIFYAFVYYEFANNNYAPAITDYARNAIFTSSDALAWSLLVADPLGADGALSRAATLLKHDGKLILPGGSAKRRYPADHPEFPGAYYTESYTNVLHSTNGTSWTDAGAGGFDSSFVSGRYPIEATGDGLLYVVSVDEKLYSSADGLSWSVVESAYTLEKPEGASPFATLRRIHYLPGLEKYFSVPRDAVIAKPYLVGAFTAALDSWGLLVTDVASTDNDDNPLVTYRFGDKLFGVAPNATNTAMRVVQLVGPVTQSSESTYTLVEGGGGDGTDLFDFTNTGGAAGTERLFFKTPSKAWTLTYGTPGTLAAVSDVDYPAATVPGTVYLDGYICVMDADGTIFNSGLEDPTSWNALDFIRAEAESDPGVALGKHMNYLVAFKQRTIEFFYNAANDTGSPFSRLPNSAQKIGCAHGRSLAEIDGGLFFLSRTSNAAPSVHYLPRGSMSPQEVATESVKRFLARANLTDVRAWAARLGGHTLYVVGLVTEGVTLVYDLTSQFWSVFALRTASVAKTVSALSQANGIASAACAAHGFEDGDRVIVAGASPIGYNSTVNVTVVDADHFTYFVSSTLATPATGTITATGTTQGGFPLFNFASCLGRDFVQHNTSTDIYEIDPNYEDDNGAYIDMKLRTLKFDGETMSPKTLAALSVIGEAATGDLLVRYSDDDYVTFSKYRPVDLDSDKPSIRGLGRFRRRAFEFRYTADGFPRLGNAELEISG